MPPIAATRRSSTRAALTIAVCGLAFWPLPSAAEDVAAAPAAIAPQKPVRPGDDFFGFVNGDWIAKAEIPAGRSSWGPAAALADETSARVIKLLESAAADRSATGEARKIGDFYAAFMDEAGIEAKGTEPLKPLLNAIDAIGDKAALARALGGMLRTDVESVTASNYDTENLFGLLVSQGFADAQHNTAFLLQGGLGMPGRDDYVADDPHSTELRTKYRQHIEATLKLAGFTDPDKRADRVFDLEMKLAQSYTTQADSDDEWKANNPWNAKDFAVKAPGLDWAAFFKAAGLGRQTVFTVWHPSAIIGSAKLVAEIDLTSWKDYLSFHLVNHYSPVLPHAFVAEHAAFYDKAVAGKAEPPPRSKQALDAANLALAEPLGHLYVDQYFPPSSKARVQAMVVAIRAEFAKHIDKLDWMAPATRKEAQAKLKALYVGIGYPDHWASYAGLAVSPTDAFGNVLRAEHFHTAERLARLGQPVDRTEWGTPSQMTYAVNLGQQDALNFAAAYLQPPYFDPNASDAANYGSIGTIIGHEISHMFDDTGAKWDAQGHLRIWWSPAELAQYKASIAKLAAQYSAYKPFPDLALDGQRTLTENMADVTGLTLSLRAYQASLAGKQEAAEAEQQFFIGFAQSRRSKISDVALRQLATTDAHAPAKYRISTVRNLDAWYRAFDVQPGQALYLAPDERLTIR